MIFEDHSQGLQVLLTWLKEMWWILSVSHTFPSFKHPYSLTGSKQMLPTSAQNVKTVLNVLDIQLSEAWARCSEGPDRTGMTKEYQIIVKATLG